VLSGLSPEPRQRNDETVLTGGKRRFRMRQDQTCRDGVDGHGQFPLEGQPKAFPGIK
jgi:hypothetical protein